MQVSDFRELSVLADHDAVRSVLCEHKTTGQRVVVRTLSLQAATSHDEVALFEREGAVLQHIDHPRLPKLLHWERDEAGGDVRLHQVRAYVEGTSLYDEVKAGRHLNEREALTTVLGIAETLQHLHARSPAIVHRDVKPENLIRIVPDALHVEGVSVIDLGALKAGPATGRTIVGTYGYMPPEQYEGRSTPASDVYALGMTLLFLLTHKAPGDFGDEGARVQLPREANVGGETKTLIEAMIAFNPADRPRDGAEVARRVRVLLDGTHPLSLPPTQTGAASSARSVMTCLVIAAVLGGVALLAVGFLGFFYFSTSAPPEPIVFELPERPPPAPNPPTPPEREPGHRLSGLVGLHADLGCAQRLLPRLLQSETRYLSWVSEGGPSGKERHIYGLYAGYDDAVARCAHHPALHALAERALPLIARAERYYDEEDYKDDAFAEGRVLHPQLIAVFSDIVRAHEEITKRIGADIAALEDHENDPDATLLRQAFRAAWPVGFPADAAKPTGAAIRLAVDALDATAKAFERAGEQQPRSLKGALAGRIEAHRRFLKQAMRGRRADSVKLQRQTLELVHDVVAVEKDFPR